MRQLAALARTIPLWTDTLLGSLTHPQSKHLCSKTLSMGLQEKIFEQQTQLLNTKDFFEEQDKVPFLLV